MMYRFMTETKSIKHDFIIRNINYTTPIAMGEIDILGYDSDTDTLHLYEVKSKETIGHIKKAMKQLRRARIAFEEYVDSVQMYIVIPNGEM